MFCVLSLREKSYIIYYYFFKFKKNNLKHHCLHIIILFKSYFIIQCLLKRYLGLKKNGIFDNNNNVNSKNLGVRNDG